MPPRQRRIFIYSGPTSVSKSPTARNLINAQRPTLVKPTAFIIDTASGVVIVQDALANALESARIAGVGIDLFEQNRRRPPVGALRTP